MGKYDNSIERSEYQHEYYERVGKAKKKANYNAQTQYVRYVEVKKMLRKLKTRIGSVSFNLVLDEIEKLERERH